MNSPSLKVLHSILLTVAWLFGNRPLTFFPCPSWPTLRTLTSPFQPPRILALPLHLVYPGARTLRLSTTISPPPHGRTLSLHRMDHNCHQGILPPPLSTRPVSHSATSTLGGSRKARSNGHGLKPKILARSG